MTKLEWGSAGERFYEAGVDRGVLYINGIGVPWNGLVSVSEEPSGGEAKPFYQDGYKYSNRSSIEEYGATITAYTYPDEFAQCDGSAQIGRGLFAGQQRRRSFDFCYRTTIGNDVKGNSLGYKIHLVYNATAAPSQNAYATMNDQLEALNFSWAVTTKPLMLSGRRPTSHFIIDSRQTDATVLKQIEDVLYGTASTAPRIPPVAELVYRFESSLAGVYDGGIVGRPQYLTLDGGYIPAAQSSTVNGGTP